MFRANEYFAEPTRRAEGGQTMTEYALILAAVAIVAIVGYLALGTSITTLVNNVIGCL
jgi:Flp pilus assembly pilin Flp